MRQSSDSDPEQRTVTGNSARAHGQAAGSHRMRGASGSRSPTASSLATTHDRRQGPTFPARSPSATATTSSAATSPATSSATAERRAVCRLFATSTPTPAAGSVNAAGIVPLRNSIANPALSGGDPLAALRHRPARHRPAAARRQPARHRRGRAQPGALDHGLGQQRRAHRHQLRQHHPGTRRGRLSQGPGRQRHALWRRPGAMSSTAAAATTGSTATAASTSSSTRGATKVTVDLSLATDKATRGTEIDTLYNIEGAIGSRRRRHLQGQRRTTTSSRAGGAGHLHRRWRPATSTTSTHRRQRDRQHHARPDQGLRGRLGQARPDGHRRRHHARPATRPSAGSARPRCTGTPGELGYFTSDGNTIVRGSNDADTTAEFQIELTGLKDARSWRLLPLNHHADQAQPEHARRATLRFPARGLCVCCPRRPFRRSLGP